MFATLDGMMADSDFSTKVTKAFSLLLIVIAVAIYLGWGIAYGSWNIFSGEYIPVYTIMIVLILFGLLGLFLSKNPADSE